MMICLGHGTITSLSCIYQVDKDDEGTVSNMSNPTKIRPFIMQTTFEYVLRTCLEATHTNT